MDKDELLATDILLSLHTPNVLAILLTSIHISEYDKTFELTKKEDA